MLDNCHTQENHYLGRKEKGISEDIVSIRWLNYGWDVAVVPALVGVVMPGLLLGDCPSFQPCYAEDTEGKAADCLASGSKDNSS